MTLIRVNPCIPGRRNHHYNAEGVCFYCDTKRPSYYVDAETHKRASENADPYGGRRDLATKLELDVFELSHFEPFWRSV